ncbi:S1 RNA-binding domain-containing protein [Streptomyces sp. NPDC001843]|uniref:S1 RNA-binding domain-containing protein n=1 Tax=Streptomyces sp. NPDC001843 TaxID=3364617 RepID=UPI003679B03A
MTEPTPTSLEGLRERLDTRAHAELRTGTVVGFGEQHVIVRLDGDDPQVPTGRIPRHLLTWTVFEDPSDVVTVGQRITAEVLSGDDRSDSVALDARACEDRALYRHLLRTRLGDVVRGTVAAVHNFGVFVRLDGAPPHPAYPGTGFIRVPDLTWAHIDHPEDVVRSGMRVVGEVITIDTNQGEVVISLKALQEDPWDRPGWCEGDVVAGRVTKLLPFGVFVSIAQDAEGLVHVSDLGGQVVGEGQELRVRILEIDRERRRIRLTLVT